MYKELVISIVIVGLIIAGNIITQNNTTQSVEEIGNELILLREELLKQEENTQQAKAYMEETNKIWEEKYDTMAYYIEHDELEKVQTELTKLKADIDMKEYSMGIESLDNAIFILEHIKDKTALKIVNIF